MDGKGHEDRVCSTPLHMMHGALLTLHRANGLAESNVADAVLITVQKNLYALKDFLDRNPHLFHSAPGDHTGARVAAVSEQEAWKVQPAFYDDEFRYLEGSVDRARIPWRLQGGLLDLLRSHFSSAPSSRASEHFIHHISCTVCPRSLPSCNQW